MPDLYHVTTIADAFGYKRVAFDWYFAEECSRRHRFDYAAAITGYDATDETVSYPVGAIDELFTREETVALKGYLDRVHGDHSETIIKPAELPLSMHDMGFGAIPSGGGQDHYQLHREPGYNLPFKAEGYHDLRHLKPAPIEFRLVRTNVFMRARCDICRGWTEKDAVMCIADSLDGRMRLCEQCIKARDFDERIAASAQGLEGHAAWLRSLSGRIQAPTHAEWERAEDIANWQYGRDDDREPTEAELEAFREEQRALREKQELASQRALKRMRETGEPVCIDDEMPF